MRREPTVSRRGLFGWLAVAPIATVSGAPCPAGFCSAPLKTEGEAIAYGGFITPKSAGSALWPGVKSWFEDHAGDEYHHHLFEG